MPGEEDSRAHSVQAISPFRWRGARILDAVCQVNEHVVSALTEIARHESASIELVRQNADTLRRLDLGACRRAARVPVLLVNLRFQDEQWWQRAANSDEAFRSPSSRTIGFSTQCAAELTRESLILAWLAVQHCKESTRLLFGMSPRVSALLAELTPRQINRLAEGCSQELSIRWQSNLTFWRKLFLAGQSGSAAELCEVRLLGLQLLGGELLGTR